MKFLKTNYGNWIRKDIIGGVYMKDYGNKWRVEIIGINNHLILSHDFTSEEGAEEYMNNVMKSINKRFLFF